MFKLVPFFVITSTLVAAAIIVVLILHRQSEVERLIDFAENQNVVLARSFANSIWPRFSTFVKSASELDNDTLRTHAEIQRIREAVRTAAIGLPVLKIKIYNLEGLTVYSSEPAEIGEDKSNNPGYFSAAKKGESASKLTFRDTFSSFEGRVQNRDLVESYLPIRRENGPIEGVFELYTDVTQLMGEIRGDTVNLVLGLLLISGMLYGILLIAVRRADRTIKRQYADISERSEALEREVTERKQVEAALKKAHDHLEHRVAERTRELRNEIGEREQAEENLRKLSRAVEQSPAMTIITGPAGNIEYVNPRFTEVTGYTLAEVAGKTPRILKSGETSQEQYEKLWRTITAGKNWQGEFHNRKKNGTLYWAATSITPITDPDGNVTNILGVSEDVTERKRAEDEARRHRSELAHFGRVSIIGEMATSLAHELNQPLTVISGCAQLGLNNLRKDTQAPAELVDALEQAAEQADRANEIIRRVRSFVQKKEQQRQTIDLNSVIRDVAGMLQTDAREHNVSIELDLADELPPIFADPIQIQQVVINLAHNGIEVMSETRPSAPLLTIRTSMLPANIIEVAVHNPGAEIPPDVLERVFEPFFTTKSEGLGMGLSISRSIVEAHGGKLSVFSKQRAGTVFRFTLPSRGED